MPLSPKRPPLVLNGLQGAPVPRSSPTIVIHADQPDAMAAILQQRHPDATIALCRDYAGLPAVLDDVRPEVMFGIRFAGGAGFPRAAILGSRTLRWVSVGGSGTDHLAPWDPPRLVVTNAAGVAADVMAAYVMGTALSLRLGLPRFGREQRAHRWTPAPVRPLSGGTMLIIGLGHTGRATARLAKAHGMRVLGLRARPAETPHVDLVAGIERLPALLPEADVIVVCVPLTDATRGLLDRTAFEAVKRGAVLVDVSRGGIVQEAALIEALSGRLAGAALDVFETEPVPPDSPLWDLPNLIMTPHSSSLYDGWEERAIELFADNLDRWRQGVPLQNVVEPARGY